MGRSLRRIKKAKPRIIKRKHKTPFTKSKTPHEITAERPDIKKKLGIEAEWNVNDKITENYNTIGFVANLNSGYGRNKKKSNLPQLPEDVADEEIDESLDDDLKAAMSKTRSTGKATPKRITANQRQVIEKLISAYGDDVAAMVVDRKLNKMQHSKGYLEKLIESYTYWSDDTKKSVDFRVPTKGLW